MHMMQLLTDTGSKRPRSGLEHTIATASSSSSSSSSSSTTSLVQPLVRSCSTDMTREKSPRHSR